MCATLTNTNDERDLQFFLESDIGVYLLEEIDTLILPTEGLRWFPIEVVAEETADSFLAILDEACAIPKPRSIAHRLAA